MVAGLCRNKQRTLNNAGLEGKQKTALEGRGSQRSSYRLSADEAEGGTSPCRDGGTVTALFPRPGRFSPASVPQYRMLVARTGRAWQGLLPRPAQSSPAAPEGVGKECILLLRERLENFRARKGFRCPISTPISNEEASNSHISISTSSAHPTRAEQEIVFPMSQKHEIPQEQIKKKKKTHPKNPPAPPPAGTFCKAKKVHIRTATNPAIRAFTQDTGQHQIPCFQFSPKLWVHFMHP